MKGFPEENDLVLCTVTKVQFHSVFCNLDEFNRSGMIHISEVSPGRIRNIRDYVKEGKVVVCKVLRIDEQKGHIDLSLRRVSESQRRQKISELKQKQKAMKIVEVAAKALKLDSKKLFSQIEKAVTKEYETVYNGFEAIVAEEATWADFGIDDKIVKELMPVIEQRIKPPEVEISGVFSLSTYAPDGVEGIKKALGVIEADDNTVVHYLGGGKYQLKLIGEDFKELEDKLKKIVSDVTKNFSGEVQFTKTEK